MFFLKSVDIKYKSHLYFATEPKFEKYSFPEIQIVNKFYTTIDVDTHNSYYKLSYPCGNILVFQ